MHRIRKAILRWHISVTATLVPLLLRWLSLRAMLALFTPPRRWQPYRGFRAEEILGLIRKRLANPVYMIRRACLREGLLLFHFMRLADLEATLHIGVHPPEAARRLRAHCWITSDGKPISDDPGEQLAKVLVYPKPDARIGDKCVALGNYSPNYR